MQAPEYPGAVEPERTRAVTSFGLRLNLLEWGDPQAMPIVACHGMWDHGRSFALVAPYLAKRFRVVAVDSRGHGDSDWASAYCWPVDVLDVVHVVRSLGRPVHLLGHSRGGGLATDAARLAAESVVKVVNIDGFGPPPFTENDEPTPARFANFLTFRRNFARWDAWRPYKSLDDLVERRRAQNPRLSREWLRYFAFHGARRSQDGWRWKADPCMTHGFSPWRPEWISLSYEALDAPMLAITGSEQDTWGPLPEKILRERLRPVKDLERRTVQGAGHFVHIEYPAETAKLILDFLV